LDWSWPYIKGILYSIMFPCVCVYASCRPATCFQQDQSTGSLRVTQVEKLMRFSRSKNTFIGLIGSRQFNALTVKCPVVKFKYILNPKNNVLQTSNTCVYCVFITTFFQTFPKIYIYICRCGWIKGPDVKFHFFADYYVETHGLFYRNS
jgi:hypothetical protein